jgi:hypothetical protein
LFAFVKADYIQRIIPSSSILTIVKIVQFPVNTPLKSTKEGQNTIAVRITAVKEAYLTTLNRDKHLAIINRLFADRDIKPSHLPITFLGMCTLAGDS